MRVTSGTAGPSTKSPGAARLIARHHLDGLDGAGRPAAGAVGERE
jgi:hypothetical protein